MQSTPPAESSRPSFERRLENLFRSTPMQPPVGVIKVSQIYIFSNIAQSIIKKIPINYNCMYLLENLYIFFTYIKDDFKLK